MPAPFLSNSAAFVLFLTSMFGHAPSDGGPEGNPGEAHERDRPDTAQRTDRAQPERADPLPDEQAPSSARRLAATRRIHAERIARLERIEVLAKSRGRSDLESRVKVAREKENQRHARALARIEDASAR